LSGAVVLLAGCGGSISSNFSTRPDRQRETATSAGHQAAPAAAQHEATDGGANGEGSAHRSVAGGYEVEPFVCPTTQARASEITGTELEPYEVGDTSQCIFADTTEGHAKVIVEFNALEGSLAAYNRKIFPEAAKREGNTCDLNDLPELGDHAWGLSCSIPGGGAASSAMFEVGDPVRTWGVAVQFLPGAPEHATPSETEDDVFELIESP
jgi:hypothetical protein